MSSSRTPTRAFKCRGGARRRDKWYMCVRPYFSSPYFSLFSTWIASFVCHGVCPENFPRGGAGAEGHRPGARQPRGFHGGAVRGGDACGFSPEVELCLACRRGVQLWAAEGGAPPAISLGALCRVHGCRMHPSSCHSWWCQVVKIVASKVPSTNAVAYEVRSSHRLRRAPGRALAYVPVVSSSHCCFWLACQPCSSPWFATGHGVAPRSLADACPTHCLVPVDTHARAHRALPPRWRRARS